MNIFEYIVLSILLGLEILIVVRSCAAKNKIQLSRGLGVSLLIATIVTGMSLIGLLAGDLLHYDLPQVDKLIHLGLLMVVVVRLVSKSMRKKREQASFNISRWGTTTLLGITVGTNAFIVGLAIGFNYSFSTEWMRLMIPMIVGGFFLNYLAIMLGRQNKGIKEKRWLLISALFLLGIALKGTFLG